MKGTCQQCGKDITGRQGKKFCSPDCKAQAHSEKKKANRVEIVDTINKILLKNRSILAEIMGSHKQRTVARIELTKLGFNFQHFTGNYLNRQGKYYHYVYDYAWMEFSSQEVLIVRK